MINVDLMRVALLELIRDEFDVDAELQGKRIVVNDSPKIIILVTQAKSL